MSNHKVGIAHFGRNFCKEALAGLAFRNDLPFIEGYKLTAVFLLEFDVRSRFHC